MRKRVGFHLGSAPGADMPRLSSLEWPLARFLLNCLVLHRACWFCPLRIPFITLYQSPQLLFLDISTGAGLYNMRRIAAKYQLQGSSLASIFWSCTGPAGLHSSPQVQHVLEAPLVLPWSDTATVVSIFLG